MRLAVSGLGHAVGDERATEYLRVPKNRKFMGPQDHLAVLATGRALASARLTPAPGERTGLFLVVGHIPFEHDDIHTLMDASMQDGLLSMASMAIRGLAAVNPRLTFRTLPNMPAFHISTNFDIQGPYQVLYPGPGQFYVALESAVAALCDGRIDQAVVCGVADRQNFLVQHHFRRAPFPSPPERLSNLAGCMIVQKAASVSAEAIVILEELSVDYRPFQPFEGSPEPSQAFSPATPDDIAAAEPGPGTLPAALSRMRARPSGETFEHRLCSRDGIVGRSAWRWV